MDLKNLLNFLRKIESIGLEYMVTGSIASILYGRPRLTQDMDIVIVFPVLKIDSFVGLFDIEEYYCPPDEAIQEAIRLGNTGHLNVIDQLTGFKIDIYPIRDDPLGKWGLQNKRMVELIEGENVCVAPPEYVILKKMLYYLEGGSQKHLDDIEGMLEVSGEQIDINTIKTWTRQLHLEDIWSKVGK